MELVLLSKNRIKIVLNNKELKEYGIVIDNFDYAETETRKIIWEIFDKAKEKTGFDAASDKILVEVFPLEVGGLEIIATKVMPASGNNIDSSNIHVYSFDTYDDLICAVTKAKGRSLFGISNLYFDSKSEKYILTLEYPSDIMLEYSHIIKKGYIKEYLFERCRLIIENNAIEEILCNTT